MAAISQLVNNTTHQFGGDGSGFVAEWGQEVTFPIDGTVTDITVSLFKAGTPADGVRIGLQSDSAGEPDDTYLDSDVVGQADIPTDAANRTDETVTGLSIPVTASTSYWLVLQRTGAQDGTNMFGTGFSNSDVYAGQLDIKTSGAWSEFTGEDLYFTITYIASASTKSPSGGVAYSAGVQLY